MRAGKHCKLSLTGIKAVLGCIYMVFSKKVRAHFISNLSWLRMATWRYPRWDLKQYKRWERQSGFLGSQLRYGTTLALFK